MYCYIVLLMWRSVLHIIIIRIRGDQLWRQNHRKKLYRYILYHNILVQVIFSRLTIYLIRLHFCNLSHSLSLCLSSDIIHRYRATTILILCTTLYIFIVRIFVCTPWRRLYYNVYTRRAVRRWRSGSLGDYFDVRPGDKVIAAQHRS